MATAIPLKKFPGFQAELHRLHVYLSQIGKEERVDGRHRHKLLHVPETEAHHVYLVPQAAVPEIKLRLQQLEALAYREMAQSPLAARPRALTLPKFFEHVHLASFSESPARLTRIISKEKLLGLLRSAPESYRALVANSKTDFWRKESCRLGVDLRALVWSSDFDGKQRVFVHGNGLILAGDDIRIELPSGRFRVQRQDAYGQPAFTWKRFNFYPASDQVIARMQRDLQESQETHAT